MCSRASRANMFLFFAALIWGAAFVAQRMGMEHMGPLTFNAVRFALGAMALLPLIQYLSSRNLASTMPGVRLVQGGLGIGVVLFLGAWLQQFGLCYTTAGKAGFITGLYVVFVPLMGIFLGHRYGVGTWAGAILAVSGMYLLSVTESLTMSRGDTLVLLSAFFWAGHVVLIGQFTQGIAAADAVKLSAIQFVACSVLSFMGALFFEEISLTGIRAGLVPLLYGGLMSVGMGYTFQVLAQRDARPAPAAIILSLEAVFAVMAGWFMLGEVLTARAMLGCTLMLSGMIWSQVKP